MEESFSKELNEDEFKILSCNTGLDIHITPFKISPNHKTY